MPARSALHRAVSILLLVAASLTTPLAVAHAEVASAKPPSTSTASATAASKSSAKPPTRTAGKTPPETSVRPAAKSPAKPPVTTVAKASTKPSTRPSVKTAEVSRKPVETARMKPATKVSERAPVPTAKAGGDTACTYTVRSGDSLDRIAARHGVTQATLVSANHLPRSGAVTAGRRLTIPGCESERRAAAERATALREMPTDGIMHARVGPRRVPTALHLALPDLSNTMTTLLWPIAGPIASPFGLRRTGWHAGVDIKADVGTPILAAAAGTVLISGWERAYGRVVKIEHDDGFLTIYAHNLQNLVAPGDRVQAGTVIATVGRSGRSSAYHLHFEVRRDGMAYNPLHVLAEREVFVARTDEPSDTEAEEAEDEPAR
jgi:murein DD-endopeptidase MepM/ murein hydrolase activator NlpD